MGWASGSRLMSSIIEGLIENDFDASTRYAVYLVVIEAMTDHDWDTIGECLGEDDQFDRAVKELYSQWFEEE